MLRRIHLILVLGALLALTGACTNKKSVNPLANIGSKQPDKVLFDKAMDAMRHNRFDVARLTLQTLINTYPDSEYIARAKLSECDSWYAEGGTASLAQAEQCYGDFEIFFPNMSEAAEAQLKTANIHFQQMEKADRDYTHAKRAEDEYRKLILTYPDSKLVPEAKRKLMEVQEVLAEREFDIGRFYFLRQSYMASIARLQSMVDKYPLYSRADEALFLLGQNYEGQIARIRNAPTCDAKNPVRGCATEEQKSDAIGKLTKQATEEYSKILTRYPMMDRADDAKKRLAALRQPIPRPTKAAVAQNKAEEASRRESTVAQRLMGFARKGPDTSMAATVGEPSLVETEPLAVSDILRRETLDLGDANKSRNTLGVQIVNPDKPGGAEAASSAEATPAGGSPFGRTAENAQPAQPDPNELKPNVADSNELKPADTGTDATLPPPVQVNEIQSGSSSSATAGADNSELASDKDMSSSKKKKKKGLRKLVLF